MNNPSDLGWGSQWWAFFQPENASVLGVFFFGGQGKFTRSRCPKDLCHLVRMNFQGVEAPVLPYTNLMIKKPWVARSSPKDPWWFWQEEQRQKHREDVGWENSSKCQKKQIEFWIDFGKTRKRVYRYMQKHITTWDIPGCSQVLHPWPWGKVTQITCQWCSSHKIFNKIALACLLTKWGYSRLQQIRIPTNQYKTISRIFQDLSGLITIPDADTDPAK